MSIARDLKALDLCSADTVSVQYKDRVWEIALSSKGDMFPEVSSIALDLQAALNLVKPPVGLRLRVATDKDAIVCPLSLLVACPSYITTTFHGMSWTPLMEGEDNNTGVIDDDVNTLPPPAPADPLIPPPLGSPIAPEMRSLEFCGSTASPSEGFGRPLTAPTGDQGRSMLRPRPGRREGLGRPLSATPSDKSFGMRRIRPAKSEGFGRPSTALPSDHSGCGGNGLRSPHGFRCSETVEDIWPFTDPDLGTGGSRCSLPSFNGRRLSEWRLDGDWASPVSSDDYAAAGSDVWTSDTGSDIRRGPRECWV